MSARFYYLWTAVAEHIRLVRYVRTRPIDLF